MNPMIVSALVAVTCAGCVAPVMRSTLSAPATPAQLSELWEAPADIAERDLFDGPWGKALAPNPATVYTFVIAKSVGVSPGFAVTDDHGMEWSVKQGPEAKVEVVMSRVLSAVGYHQPPVYYLPRWTIRGGPSTTEQSEARFRPKHSVMKDEGEWSWQENPFVGTRPYNGLRVLMMILNESDLKNSNNSLYEVKEPGEAGKATHRWYVVRDIGTALGESGRIDPRRNDPEMFQRTRFINHVKNDEVDFNYQGRHQELTRNIAPEDVRWICELLARLRIEQWRDAFRAGGYEPDLAERFISRIGEKIAEGLALAP
jgi:hypothetical protein